MSTSDFDKYKVDHLFLLMGENPLPNYVAARLLLSKDGTAYLVHTTSTEPQAKRLQRILKSEVPSFKDIQLLSLNNWESDAYHIQDEIRRKVKSIKDGRIGMNYTGGTKAMAVHAYRTLFKENRPDTVFSYLDPRRLEMCIDREDRESDRIKVTPDMLEVKLLDLFQIHDLELKHSPVIIAVLPELAIKLVQIYTDKDKLKAWHQWLHEIFSKAARKQKQNGTLGDWKSKSELIKLSLPIDILPDEIQEAFKSVNFIDTDGKLSINYIEQQNIFSEPKYFCKWLEGVWLENHVLQTVESLSNRYSIKHYGLNFEIPLNGTQDGFEFDVAFTRGYQLFAISCTTDVSRPLCKSKLFEAYLRAQQMGGSEARVALVCCFDNPDSLKAELATLLGNNKVIVFGQEHLLDLSDEIAKWIEQNDQEAK